MPGQPVAVYRFVYWPVFVRHPKAPPQGISGLDNTLNPGRDSVYKMLLFVTRCMRCPLQINSLTINVFAGVKTDLIKNYWVLVSSDRKNVIGKIYDVGRAQNSREGGNMNYFKAICFVWAAIGIGSRVIMGIMGEKWKDWELNSAYKADKNNILNLIGIIGCLMVTYTWYMVVVSDVKYSWIIALLITSTVVKISTIMFNYKAFRNFVSKTLNDKKKMLQLNIGVVIFSITLVFMGCYLY